MCEDQKTPFNAVHDSETEETRAVKVEEDVFARNNQLADQNRRYFAQHKLLVLNLVSSPGSGKTTLLARTLQEKRFQSAVIEGDQSTALDADRIRATGVPVVQINTGQGCHLDAHMVETAAADLPLAKGGMDGGVLFIENVGNLVCPAAFDLGEAAKVVLLSVTEGEDKPLKYPHMFRASSLMIVTKMDLVPYVPFNVERCIAYAREINPEIEVLKLSTTSGEGLEDWFAWLKARQTKVAAS
jgi:hydrogenase nickel incorporation protein HypB